LTDQEALQVIIKVTDLRLNAQYQSAEAMRRRSGVESMAQSNPNSDEYAAVRLLIGVWERIAMFVSEFNDNQRRRFFRCNPVGLVWRYLEPGVVIIRKRGSVGPKFAKEFETLARQYTEWTQGSDGADFRTEADQVVCALFA
jgi:hypothetical protein